MRCIVRAGLGNCWREKGQFQRRVVFKRKRWWLARDSMHLCKSLILLRITKTSPCAAAILSGKKQQMACSFRLAGGNWGSFLGLLTAEPWRVIKRNEGETLPQRTQHKFPSICVPDHAFAWDFHRTWVNNCLVLVESLRIQLFINLSCFHTHPQVCCLEFPNSN